MMSKIYERETAVYLGGAWGERDSIAEEAKKWREAGFIVESTWHDGEPNDNLKEAAIKDIEDLHGANVLVYYTDGNGAGGRDVEFGIALRSGQGLVVVGESENVFHFLDLVIRADTTEEATELTKLHWIPVSIPKQAVTYHVAEARGDWRESRIQIRNRAKEQDGEAVQCEGDSEGVGVGDTSGESLPPSTAGDPPEGDDNLRLEDDDTDADEGGGDLDG